MRQLGIGVVVTLVLAGTLVGGQGKTDPALDKLAKEFAVAFNAKDAARVGSFYAEDAVLMPPNGPMVKGRASIEAEWKRVLGQGVTNLQLRPMESIITGTQAFEAGTSTLTVKGGAPQHGKYVVVYKRVGSEWKIAYDIFNDDQPAPPMEKK
jgi:ketosteroid isomerase-like protein